MLQTLFATTLASSPDNGPNIIKIVGAIVIALVIMGAVMLVNRTRRRRRDK